MHEYAICVALLEQVERLTDQHRAEHVERILLKVGPLSGVEPELLRQAWPMAATRSIAEAAELVIEDSPVVVKCSRCDAEMEVPPNRLRCTQCGDFRTRLISGDEMILSRVELTKQEQKACASPSP